MPSFESLILSSPTGFIAGCNEINTIDNDIFMNILEIAIKKVYTGDLVTNVNNNSYIFTALLYLINSYKLAYPQPTPQQFASILDNNTTLSRNIIATIIESIGIFVHFYFILMIINDYSLYILFRKIFKGRST